MVILNDKDWKPMMSWQSTERWARHWRYMLSVEWKPIKLKWLLEKCHMAGKWSYRYSARLENEKEYNARTVTCGGQGLEDL